MQSEPTPGVAWVIELYFNDGGTGSFAGGSTETFTYAQDAWIFVGINFDLDSDLVQVFFDGVLMVEFANELTIGAINYFGSDTGGQPGAYYDDVCFQPGALFVGIAENARATSRIYPNPANDIVNISSADQIISVQVFNSFGSLVSSRMINNDTGKISTKHLAPGLYIFRIQTASGFTTHRVVIQ